MHDAFGGPRGRRIVRIKRDLTYPKAGKDADHLGQVRADGVMAGMPHIIVGRREAPDGGRRDGLDALANAGVGPRSPCEDGRKRLAEMAAGVPMHANGNIVLERGRS